MANSTDYQFEDVEVVIDGIPYLASGLITVEYVIDPADPSVGIMHDSAEVYGYGVADIEVEDEYGDILSIIVRPGTDEHAQIVRGLDRDYVEEACRIAYFD